MGENLTGIAHQRGKPALLCVGHRNTRTLSQAGGACGVQLMSVRALISKLSAESSRATGPTLREPLDVPQGLWLPLQPRSSEVKAAAKHHSSRVAFQPRFSLKSSAMHSKNRQEQPAGHRWKEEHLSHFSQKKPTFCAPGFTHH